MIQQVQEESESFIKTQNPRTKWTPQEDNELKKGVKICGMNWIAISLYVHNRNPNQCAQRWKRLQGKRSRTNNFWKPEEDLELALLVQQLGKKWTKIAKIVQNRNSKQCRDRFTNTIDPELKKNCFTPEEDQLIYEKYLEYGPRWSSISRLLQGRSDNQVKNRFYTTIRSKYLQCQNPYYSKQVACSSKEQLEKAREEQLKKLEYFKKEETLWDQNEMQTKDQDISKYISQQDHSNFQVEFYSYINIEEEVWSSENENKL
ncbi:unnamed protein product [Paramecium octaurelia]|uniref:Uncharacterized protein n=1 Tax=Paramecium octaurelia TaxID=43137 RepID=A0A8S1TQ12_PAROT|nr:unnamed protein product [Paramecium octaurelia]